VQRYWYSKIGRIGRWRYLYKHVRVVESSIAVNYIAIEEERSNAESCRCFWITAEHSPGARRHDLPARRAEYGSSWGTAGESRPTVPRTARDRYGPAAAARKTSLGPEHFRCGATREQSATRAAHLVTVSGPIDEIDELGSGAAPRTRQRQMRGRGHLLGASSGANLTLGARA
jgi:hypothetical protein